MLRFHKIYFLLALLLFAIEVCIAVYVNDRFIRPYVGDFLVVILLYCFLRSFLNLPVKTLAVAVLLFAYVVEVSQYFHVVNKLGLQDHKILRVVLGSSFEWSDMLAYTLGTLLIVFLDNSKPSVAA